MNAVASRPGALVVAVVLVVGVSSVAAPALAVDVDALLRGVDVAPPPAVVEALSPADVAALLAVADDDGALVVRRARALRLAAGAAAGEAAVDAVIARWLVSPERELRVQAAWASVGRAMRAGRGLATAVSLLQADDGALREVGAIALAREGSMAARRHLEARLAVEHDVDVAAVLRARLARWPAAPSSPGVPATGQAAPRPAAKPPVAHHRRR